MARGTPSPGVSGHAERRHYRRIARLPFKLDRGLFPDETRWQDKPRLHGDRGISRKTAAAYPERRDDHI